MGNLTASPVQAKTIKLKNYTIHEQLGNGAFGTVFKASKKGRDEMVAIKVVPIEPGDEKWKKEAEAAKELSSHTNIVNIYETKQKGCNFYIIMELCEGGDLNNYVIQKGKSTGMKERLGFMQDIAKGVEYLHRKNFIHRDIKPQNVLITTEGERKVCKLGDFGLAHIQGKADHYFTSIVGTKIYAAPEVFSELTPKYSYPADIFSLGTLYHAITLVYIVTDSEDKLHHLIPAISDGGRDRPVTSVVSEEHLVYTTFMDKYNKSDSEELGQLVFLMIQKNPKIRPDIGAVVRSLRRIGAHPEKKPWEETKFDLDVLLQMFSLNSLLADSDGGVFSDAISFQTANRCPDDSGIN